MPQSPPDEVFVSIINSFTVPQFLSFFSNSDAPHHTEGKPIATRLRTDIHTITARTNLLVENLMQIV